MMKSFIKHIKNHWDNWFWNISAISVFFCAWMCDKYPQYFYYFTANAIIITIALFLRIKELEKNNEGSN